MDKDTDRLLPPEPRERQTSSRSNQSVVSEDEFVYEGCNACNPVHWSHRFIFLLLICFLSFGNYFVYDNPAALQSQFKKDMDINTSQFMLMYSLYSWPNVVLCFIGGFLMDKVLGLRLSAILFASFVAAGQCVCAVGASIGSYPLILVGRLIFGLGGENLAVAQNTYAVSWFKGRELNMVFGLQLSFSRVGSTVNMITMGPIYNAIGDGEGGHRVLGTALWVGAALCIFSLLTAFAAAFLDRRAQRILGRGAAEVGEKIQLKDILSFPYSFWLISIVCVAYYVAIFPFIGLALALYEQKFGLPAGTASTANSLVYTISAVASPLFGYGVDLLGRNLTWCLVAIATTLGAHALLAYTFINPFVPVVIMGIAYSMLASALWPMVAYIVPEHQLGTAYGFMQAVQNLGLAVISMVSGLIMDSKGYLWLEVFFCACICLALMTCVLLYLDDAAKTGPLNLSAQVRQQIEDAAKSAAEIKQEESVYEDRLVKPQSRMQLRNRLMSKLGLQLPAGVAQSMMVRHRAPSVLK